MEQWSSLTEPLVDYLLNNHLPEFTEIVKATDTLAHYSVVVHFVHLLEVLPKCCQHIVVNSFKFLPIFDGACVETASRIVLYSEEPSWSFKKNIHFRIEGFPPNLHRFKSNLPRVKDIGRFACIQGTVTKITIHKVYDYRKEFECKRCGHVTVVEPDYKQHYLLIPPSGQCDNPDKPCNSKFYQPVKGSADTYRRDYQEFKLQEPLNKLATGAIPSHIWVTLEDDLVECTKPGDEVTVSGTVECRWNPLVKGERTVLELALKCNHLRVVNGASNDDNAQRNAVMMEKFTSFWEEHAHNPLRGRNIIISSFCPQLYGLFNIKLATSIVLAGGVVRQDKTGTRVRGQSHLLLIGDCGSGKSQMLKYISKVSRRAIFITGTGSTSAGMTVSAIRENGQWSLEAGALVLADGGVCCIDNFHSIADKDRDSLHEVLEQQLVSVAKAGMTCKINTRCSVVAATNAKGGFYNPRIPVTENCDIASPLLSRFDMILVLHDVKDEDWDFHFADKMLNTDNNGVEENELGAALMPNQDPRWSFEDLRMYLTLVKDFKPTLTRGAKKILSEYYLIQRQTEENRDGRTTVRLFESLIRLSQGHAKLMFRDKVTVMDAIVVVDLVDSSITFGVHSKNNIRSMPPTNEMENYETTAKKILDKLGISVSDGTLDDSLLFEDMDE